MLVSTCSSTGLNPSTGMPRDDVALSVVVGHVHEAIAQLTGLPAGWRAVNREFGSGSIKANTEAHLPDFAATRVGQIETAAERKIRDD